MYLVDMDPLLRVWGHGGLHRPCMLIGSSAHLSAKEASELIPQPVNLKPKHYPRLSQDLHHKREAGKLASVKQAKL